MAKSTWTGMDRTIANVNSLVTNSKNLQRDFLNMCAKEVLNYLKSVTPRDTGTTANSWYIQNKTATSVTIANKNEDILKYILSGQQGGREIFPNEAKTFYFEIGGQEFFRTSITLKGQSPRNFMIGVNKVMAKFNDALMDALVAKYWKVFHKQANNPRSVKFANISRTVGVGQGTKRRSSRGRGKITMVRARTGRRQFKRRLGRRRRTGSFVTTDHKVEMK